MMMRVVVFCFGCGSDVFGKLLCLMVSVTVTSARQLVSLELFGPPSFMYSNERLEMPLLATN
jgi:hypothetical protein